MRRLPQEKNKFSAIFLNVLKKKVLLCFFKFGQCHCPQAAPFMYHFGVSVAKGTDSTTPVVVDVFVGDQQTFIDCQTLAAYILRKRVHLFPLALSWLNECDDENLKQHWYDCDRKIIKTNYRCDDEQFPHFFRKFVPLFPQLISLHYNYAITVNNKARFCMNALKRLSACHFSTTPLFIIDMY